MQSDKFIDLPKDVAPKIRERHLHQIELANRWRISPRTLERWRWLGRGPAYVKIGGRVVYLLEDVLTFESAQRRNGRPAASQ